MLVAASFILPFVIAPGQLDNFFANRPAGQGGKWAPTILGYVLLFAFYFVNYFVIVFFNTALIALRHCSFQGRGADAA